VRFSTDQIEDDDEHEDDLFAPLHDSRLTDPAFVGSVSPYPPVAGRPPGGLSGAGVGGVLGEALFAEAKRSPELWIR
jgi:hypothetical protein